MKENHNQSEFTTFNREFFEAEEKFTLIGNGSLGGKASGLAFMKKIIDGHFKNNLYKNIHIAIPTLTVICTDYFDLFMKQNSLYEAACSDLADTEIARIFQRASLPVQIVGDLRALIEKIHTPLAVRSSSLLEDDKYEPFAGVYATKMIPNNQADADTRFKKLVEAIKFVYASAFFKEAKAYIRATGHSLEEEKMAVIIQEVVGLTHNNRYYPHFSGVARSYNFYPTGHAEPEDGVVNLALGLGKTIVENGLCWIYSPAYPRSPVPFNSIDDILINTQQRFWAINMGKNPEYDPIRETEYLVQPGLTEAEKDDVLTWLASTFVPAAEKIYPGVVHNGPRIINFAPMIELELLPVNDLLKELLILCEEKIGSKVEIEFAGTIENNKADKIHLGFLQVRPMVISSQMVKIEEEEWNSADLLLRSDNVMGNGELNDITDLVYIKPDKFEARNTPLMVEELEGINHKLANQKKPYLLIVMGRLGSSDPWLGIPVQWGQISSARAIVETTLPAMNVDFSQGSHFFHNINSMQIFYFSIHHSSSNLIDWNWLNNQTVIEETGFFRHVSLEKKLAIKVNGRERKGIILK